jgi:DsbC/DsbD-like thiol-disulfide interchange protein
MPFLSRLITFALLALLGPTQASYAQEGSPWSEGHQSRVRLMGGGADATGQLAGVEIVLDQGFKTYWRNPGESGLPPAFDWSESTNLGAAEVLWPAPKRSEDVGGVSFGYHGRVLFPVRVRPQDPTKAVVLALKIDYGVCKDICIPAKAELSLKLPATAPLAMRAPMKAALARVPKPQPLKAEGELAVLDAEPTTTDGNPRLAVRVRAPSGTNSDLFVEGPDNWFLLAAPQPDASGTFQVDVLERPKDATGPINLRFTLVAGDKAVETSTSLDAARLRR